MILTMTIGGGLALGLVLLGVLSFSKSPVFTTPDDTPSTVYAASQSGIRHGIVHRADRLTHNDRPRAQWIVDHGRWLYNQIEGKPECAKLRDRVPTVVGTIAMTVRFPTKVIDGKLVVQPLFPPSRKTQ